MGCDRARDPARRARPAPPGTAGRPRRLRRQGVSEAPPAADAPWQRGAATAVIDGNTGWDYDALAARVAARAARLRAQGLAAGEVVLVPDQPGTDLLIMQHALWRLRAALLPISPTSDPARRAALIVRAGVEWQWTPTEAGEGRLYPTGQARAATVPSLPNPLAAVIETSGSSGEARAALLTQSAVQAACQLSNAHLGLGPDDRWLCCLPRHHVGGLSIGWRCALAGAAVVVQAGFDAATVHAALVRHRVTHVSLVPPMLARLLALGAPAPPTLRVVLVGGQALHGALAEQARAAGWPLRVTYGMTETCSQVATSGVLAHAPEPGVIGPPLPGVEIDCPPAGATPGRLRVRGPILMAGYATPERRAGVGLDADGWLTTSDLAVRTETGALRVLGRADDALVIGGHNVFPLQVEGRLLRAPGVSAACVIGLVEPVWGHSLAAAYAGTCEVATLERWCREHLPSPERPRRLLRLTSLPLLPSGKYDRARVRQLLGERG
nr:AMP-binding protein [Thiococcus pfennigii]